MKTTDTPSSRPGPGTRFPKLGLGAVLLAAACTTAIPSSTVPATTPSAAQPSALPAHTVLPSPSAEASSPGGPPEGTISFDVQPLPRFVLAGDDALWGIAQQDGARSIVRLDPVSNSVETVVEGLPVLPNPIHGMAANGSLWISSWDKSVVTEYDAESGAEIAEHPVGLHPIEPVYAFGDIWTLNHDGGSVSRIDTAAKEVAATLELGLGEEPIWAHAGGGLLWVVGVTSTVYGINPETNTVSRTVETDLEDLVGVAHIANRLWLRSFGDDTTKLFDPDSGESLGPLDQPVRGAQPLELNGRLWLPRVSGGDYVDALVAIDPQSLEIVDEFELGERFSEGEYTVAFDSIWVSGREGIMRVPAEALPTP
jgi:hypothetical protein